MRSGFIDRLLPGMPAKGQVPTHGAAPMRPPSWQEQRVRMIDELRARGIRDPRVIETMRELPRHLFVPADVRASAYDDRALPIGFDQLLSSPYVVGLTTSALRLRPRHRVLEVGTGSGYQAALLGALALEVYSVESVKALSNRALENLVAMERRNVRLHCGDGHQGWPAHAPFDRILVTAAPAEPPPALVDQLVVGGLLVMAIGEQEREVRIWERTDAGLDAVATTPVRPARIPGKALGNG